MLNNITKLNEHFAKFGAINNGASSIVKINDPHNITNVLNEKAQSWGDYATWVKRIISHFDNPLQIFNRKEKDTVDVY